MTQITLESLENFSPSFRRHREAMSPESISLLAQVDKWIPRSRYARPGMTPVVGMSELPILR